MGQSRLGASCCVGMDRPFGACTIELFRGQSQLLLSRGGAPSRDGLPDLAHLRLDRRFHRPILGPPLEALAMSFLSALSVHSPSSVNRFKCVLLVGKYLS